LVASHPEMGPWAVPGRLNMLTIVFLIVLGAALAIAGIVIASTARHRRRKGQHGVPFESAESRAGRTPRLD
jgi:NADH:ubiquinone oxidoreductase subunit 3 (subunit A)